MSAVLRSALSMSLVTGVSRITGFFRTTTQAAVLGTTVFSQAYTNANVLPNQIYELFVGGLLSSIFVPLLVSRMTTEGERDSREFASVLANLIVPLLVILSLLAVVFAGPLVDLVTKYEAAQRAGPESAERTTALAVLLFRVFALQVLFYGIGALATGILNAHRRFFLPTFAPILNNLVVIASFGLFALLFGADPILALYVLAGGTTFGVAVMSLLLLPPVWRLGYRPQLKFTHPALGSAARLAGPLLVFVAASVGIQLFANFLGSGFYGSTELQYAFTIFQLPYGVFVVAIVTALVPELSESHASGDVEGYRNGLSFGLRMLAFVVVPASVGMVTLSVPIVGLLYERGRFGPDDTLMVAAILRAYGVGLLGYAAYFMLVRAFYSRQNTRTPALLNVGLLVLYCALAYGLSRTMLGLEGVAYALSGAYAVLAVALLVAMRRESGSLDGRRLLRSLTKILAAGAAMYAVASAGVWLTGTGTNALDRAAVLVVVGGAAVASYLAAAHLLRADELKNVDSLVRRRKSSGG